MYQKIIMQNFGGLNSNIQLIHNPEKEFAADILNYKHKISNKIESRNGYEFGAYNPRIAVTFSDINTIDNNLGILGISEFLLPGEASEYVYGGNRYMVYAYRLGFDGLNSDGTIEPDRYKFSLDLLHLNQLLTNYISNQTVQSIDINEYGYPVYNGIMHIDYDLGQMTYIDKDNYMIYAFVPLETADRNYVLPARFLFNGKLGSGPLNHMTRRSYYREYYFNDNSGDIIRYKDLYPNRQLRNEKHVLYAPNKFRISDNENDLWINQYVDISEYRHQLIISDKINGDVTIRDLLADQEQGVTQDHQLEILPNCKPVLDPDIINIDYRIGIGEENSETEGVKHGMALYNYELKKSNQKGTVNPCRNEVSNPETYGGDTVPGELALAISKTIGNTAYITFKNAVYKHTGEFDWDVEGSRFERQNDEYYRFSNGEDGVEFNDIDKEVQLHEDEYIDPETGETIKETSSDVYIWNDLELQYFPTKGSVLDGTYLMDATDRVFDKKIPQKSRITKLEEKDKYSKKLPLGTWRYKFVWDYGDGRYSVASTEKLVSDILWSAIPDNDLIKGSGSQDYAPYYERPKLLDQYEFRRNNLLSTLSTGPQDITTLSPVFPYNLYEPRYFEPTRRYTIPLTYLFDNQGKLSRLGQNFFKIKEKIYGKQNHRFGIKDWQLNDQGYIEDRDSNIINFNEIDNIKNYIDFTTLITTLVPDHTIKLNGTFYEANLILFDNATIRDIFKDAVDNQIHVFVSTGNITVPTFADRSNARSVMSLFDSEGNLRLANSPVRVLALPTLMKTPVPPTRPPSGYYLDWPPYYLPLSVFNKAGYDVHESNDVYLEFYARSNEEISNACRIQFGLDRLSINTDDIIYSSRLVFAENNVPEQYDWHGTFIKGIIDQGDDLRYIRSDIDSEVVDRLIKPGILELDLLNRDSALYETDTAANYDADNLICEHVLATWRYEGNVTMPVATLNENINFATLWSSEYLGYFPEIFPRLFTVIDDKFETNHNVAVGRAEYEDSLLYDKHNVSHIGKNLDIFSYTPATRLLALEQLTSYFPSSLLFGAPRVGIRISYENVPKDAKKLLIYRTLATVDNEYEPNNYGLVDEIEIKRFDHTIDDDTKINIYDIHANQVIQTVDYDNQLIYPLTDGDAITEDVIINGQKRTFHGIYYFDDVRDEALDFTSSPNDYDGLYFPLQSRFNISLNERLYYANFIETYQPLHPTSDISYYLFKGDKGFPSGTELEYAFVFKDINDIVSRPGVLQDALYTTKITLGTDGTKIIEDPDEYGNGDNYVVGLYWLPSPYNDSIKYLEVYRRRSPHAEFKYIGKIETTPDTEGLFIDDFLPDGAVLGSTDPITMEYQSGLRWSEPYLPDTIKFDSFIEYKSGDQSQITGIESLAGNLLIFKENSMHRVAVQADLPPLSRTDEISPTLGCIAPHTIKNVNNYVYFLSADGFYVYDNNMPKLLDAQYSGELKMRMKALGDDIREATVGYNQHDNSICLNIPYITTGHSIQDYDEIPIYPINYYRDNSVPDGDPIKVIQENVHRIYGNIYVHNLYTGAVTKYSYPGTWVLNGITQNLITDGRQMVRMYYNDTQGNLRSADIMPHLYVQTTSDVGFNWAGIYIESIYNSPKTELRVSTSAPVAFIGNNVTQLGVNYDAILDRFAKFPGNQSAQFPRTLPKAIHNYYRSSLIDLGSEVTIKRLRKILFNIYAQSGIRIDLWVYPYDSAYSMQGMGVDDISSIYPSDPIFNNTFNFGATVSSVNIDNISISPQLWNNTGSNVIEIVPSAPRNPLLVEDYFGKPIVFSIAIDTQAYTQLNSIESHLRPIWEWLR
jgi:hypothetical protein